MAFTSAPLVALRDLLQNINCTSACCGGRVVHDDDPEETERVPSRRLLRSITSRWFRRSRRLAQRSQEKAGRADVA